MRQMSRRALMSVFSLMLVTTFLYPARTSAVEFTIVGPRAMGMGGAGVAVTTDAPATYWNPAGLAMSQTIDIRVQGSGQIIDRLGVADTINDINDFDRSDTTPA